MKKLKEYLKSPDNIPKHQQCNIIGTAIQQWREFLRQEQL